MNFFQPIIANPNATYETLEKKRVAWNSGLRGADICKLSDETKSKLKGKKAWNKGICHLNDSAKKRISEASKANKQKDLGRYDRTDEIKDKTRQKSSIPVMTPDGIFPSKGDAADYYGVHRNNFGKWMKKWPDQYFALEERNNKGNSTKGPNRKGGRVSKAIMTPNGLINGGIQEIMKLSGRPYATVWWWIQRYPEHYYYINKEITK